MERGLGKFALSVSRVAQGLGLSALVAGVFLAVGSDPLSGQNSDGLVTFTRDVAPILQENCQTCHREGSIAPRPWTSYEEVRPFAALIKERVESRAMPPWPLDKTIGIQEFKNDISLSEEEIRTIVEWVDSGAPMGIRRTCRHRSNGRRSRTTGSTKSISVARRIS